MADDLRGAGRAIARSETPVGQLFLWAITIRGSFFDRSRIGNGWEGAQPEHFLRFFGGAILFLKGKMGAHFNFLGEKSGRKPVDIGPSEGGIELFSCFGEGKWNFFEGNRRVKNAHIRPSGPSLLENTTNFRKILFL